MAQMAKFHSFCGWVVLHCVYVPHLYPFVCWWTFRLFCCIGNCNLCCCEHWSACIFQISVLGYFHAYPGVELLGHIAVPFFVFWRNLQLSSVDINLHSHQQCTGSLLSTSLPTFLICVLFNDGHSDRCEVVFHCGFDLHFPDD